MHLVHQIKWRVKVARARQEVSYCKSNLLWSSSRDLTLRAERISCCTFVIAMVSEARSLIYLLRIFANPISLSLSCSFTAFQRLLRRRCRTGSLRKLAVVDIACSCMCSCVNQGISLSNFNVRSTDKASRNCSDKREQHRIGTGLIPEQPDKSKTTYIHQGKEGAVERYTLPRTVGSSGSQSVLLTSCGQLPVEVFRGSGYRTG